MILSKSCSRCGGSAIFKGRTVQKSTQGATLNDTGNKKRQKSLPAPSPDVLFRLWARFLSILGSRLDPKLAKQTPQGDTRFIFGPYFFDFFSFSSLGSIPEGSRTNSGGSGDLPGPHFRRFCHTFLPMLPAICRGLLGSTGMLPGYTPDLRNSLCGVPPGVRRSRAAI